MRANSSNKSSASQQQQPQRRLSAGSASSSSSSSSLVMTPRRRRTTTPRHIGLTASATAAAVLLLALLVADQHITPVRCQQPPSFSTATPNLSAVAASATPAAAATQGPAAAAPQPSCEKVRSLLELRGVHMTDDAAAVGSAQQQANNGEFIDFDYLHVRWWCQAFSVAQIAGGLITLGSN